MSEHFFIRHFQVDVTPPVGDYLCGGLHDTSLGIETPLYLRGAILSANGTRYVFACIDYCYLCGRSQSRLTAALADGADIPSSQVTLHSNHVHDAPLIDEEAHAIVAEHGLELHNEDYFSGVIAETRNAVRAALEKPGIAVGGISYTRHPVHEFASTRRLIGPDGKCQVRFSRCQDPEIKHLPEGRIEPLLDQLVFFNAQGEPISAISFYASHPQVSDGRRLISNDTVGVAIDLFEKNHPTVFPMYFMACGADITAGKYTTTDRPRNRLVFGVRLYDGMQGAFSAARAEPLQRVGWADSTITLPLRQIPEGEAFFAAQVADDNLPSSERYLAAVKVQRFRDRIDSYPFRVSRLRLNDIDILFLPTEIVIDYQMFAREQCRGRLAIAAYGDSFLKYVAHDAAFDEGGYEVEPLWTEVDKGIQTPIRDAIARILA